MIGKSLTFIYSVIQKCGIIPVVFDVVGGHCRVTANQKRLQFTKVLIFHTYYCIFQFALIFKFPNRIQKEVHYMSYLIFSFSRKSVDPIRTQWCTQSKLYSLCHIDTLLSSNSFHQLMKNTYDFGSFSVTTFALASSFFHENFHTCAENSNSAFDYSACVVQEPRKVFRVLC
jgi:hypothetical protein